MESMDLAEDDMTPRLLHARMLSPRRQSLLCSPLSSVHAGMQRRQALCIEFKELGLQLRSCGGKTVLQGVTGMLPGGRVTAIMGPSGAGKTSLLNVLAGKAEAYGVQTGTTFLNGRPDRLERYRRVMGFVPQDDIMHASLTVTENLLFAARYRLPARCTREQHLLSVERAIAVLQLEDVRDSRIGNEEQRGISGGQRKRVNVGLELVADPLMLFLDEPTSGLDSTASKALVAALQAVARSGVTVAAVVHQPSWQTCCCLDFLLLLGKGGRTVYCGAMMGAQPYFEGLGYEVPAHQNPADAFLDITSGELLRPGQASAQRLFDDWDHHCGRASKAAAQPGAASSNGLPGGGLPGAQQQQQQQQPAEQQPLLEPAAMEQGYAAANGGEVGGASADSELLGDEEERRSWKRRFREVALFAGAYLAAVASNAWGAVKHAVPFGDASQLGPRLFSRHKQDSGSEGGTGQGGASVRALPRREPPGFLPQFWWCLGRAVVKQGREPLSVFTDYAIFALTGMTLGLISDRGRETIMHFAVSITYSVVALGLLSTVGALGTFSRDRVVLQREAASGLHRVAHFLALDTWDHVGTVLRSAVFLFMYCSFASPRRAGAYGWTDACCGCLCLLAVIWQMLLVSIAITYCCVGIAYLLSQLMEPSAAQLSAAVLALINTLIARQGHPGALLRLAQAFSFARWGLEGYVIAESNKLTGVWLLARCADLEMLAYDVRHFGRCLLALFGLGLMFRAAALLAMLSRVRR